MGNDTENIKILCIGVGGAGTNVINRMKDIGIPNAEFLTFGGYRYDYSHPEIPHYNLIEVNEIVLVILYVSIHTAKVIKSFYIWKVFVVFVSIFSNI